MPRCDECMYQSPYGDCIMGLEKYDKYENFLYCRYGYKKLDRLFREYQDGVHEHYKLMYEYLEESLREKELGNNGNNI